MKTAEELRHDFYEWFDENPNKRIWDWVHLQLEQQNYKQSIIGLIDEMIEIAKHRRLKITDYANDLTKTTTPEYYCEVGYKDALTELKEKIEKLNG